MMDENTVQTELSKPFALNDLEWRVQRAWVKNGHPGAMVLAYVTNRAIMARLDNIFGPMGWENEYKMGPVGGLMCGIGVWYKGTKVTKWDAAEASNIEPVKGAHSNSMKRAAVQWGIGRYLYALPPGYAVFSQEGKHYAKIQEQAYYWNPPEIPAWAMPEVKEEQGLLTY